jgi:hypothetical protein
MRRVPADSKLSKQVNMLIVKGIVLANKCYGKRNRNSTTTTLDPHEGLKTPEKLRFEHIGVQLQSPNQSKHLFSILRDCASYRIDI